MPVKFVRRQHAVGQGGFHTAVLEQCNDGCAKPNEDDASDHKHETFSYVYDCGEWGNHPEALRREVANFKIDQDVDILFISHAHADHINGIETLVNRVRGGGKRIVTVVMPLLTFGEKLLTLAESSQGGQPVTAFTRDIVIDPLSAFGEQTNVIFVSGGTSESWGQDLSPDEGEMWSFEGPPPIRRPDGTFEVSHSQDIRVSLGSGGPDWRLRTFVDPESVGTVDKFLEELDEILRDNEIAIDVLGRLKTVEDLRSLVADHGDHLRTAYLRVAEVQNLNVTSMSLFSGPHKFEFTPREVRELSYYDRHASYWHQTPDPEWDQSVAEIGWLGTGDAMLADEQRWRSFRKHFEDVASQVVTLVLPHHGSADNHQKAIFASFTGLERVVVAAEPPAHWRHPASRVVIDAANNGVALKLVTSKQITALHESYAWSLPWLWPCDVICYGKAPRWRRPPARMPRGA